MLAENKNKSKNKNKNKIMLYGMYLDFYVDVFIVRNKKKKDILTFLLFMRINDAQNFAVCNMK
jgi:hypothetical protein